MILEYECAIKPLLTRKPGTRCEAYKHSDDRNAEQLHDVTFFVMPDFMRNHGFKFRLGKLAYERVEKDNFAKTSEAGEEGIGVTRSFAAVHYFDAAGWKIGAPGHGKAAFAHRVVRQRAEL